MKSRKFRVEFRASAAKELERIDTRYYNRVVQKIESLAANAFPRGCVKLSGEENIYRIRVGDFRIFYEIRLDEEKVVIGHVMHRQASYKKK